MVFKARKAVDTQRKQRLEQEASVYLTGGAGGDSKCGNLSDLMVAAHRINLMDDETFTAGFAAMVTKSDIEELKSIRNDAEVLAKDLYDIITALEEGTESRAW